MTNHGTLGVIRLAKDLAVVFAEHRWKWQGHVPKAKEIEETIWMLAREAVKEQSRVSTGRLTAFLHGKVVVVLLDAKGFNLSVELQADFVAVQSPGAAPQEPPSGTEGGK